MADDPPSSATRPERVVLLGGGIGSMMAAYEITNAPDWQTHYDLTVYQLGWRLGGKGASGRNAEHFDRIEEHGLHILLGFYDNAFRVLKACYEELGRPPGAPLATWRDAFKPHNYVVLMDTFAGRWTPWVLDFPPNGQEPGDGTVLPSWKSLLEMTLGWLKRIWEGVGGPTAGEPAPAHPSLLSAIEGAVKEVVDDIRVGAHLEEVHDWLHQTQQELLHPVDDPNAGDILDGVNEALDTARRAFVTIDLGLAAMRGLFAAGAWKPGFDIFSLDTLDFRAWLKKHGAWEYSVISGYTKGMYDLGFSLPGQVGAGTAVNGIMRLVWTYKGAVFWEMQAGMGDTIFGPLYEVLKRRGVKFEFFARVDSMLPSADGSRVERIVIGRQATLKTGSYDPLVDVKGLPCWPSEPRYDQLVEGEALRASGQDLEDWWTTWKDPAPPRVLQAGADFDHVILGCSIGIFPYICPELMKVSKPLADMVANVGTTQTQAMQLWFKPDLEGLGWTRPKPVLDAYEDPMNTWSDMTHLLPRESWPATDEPKNLAYLCGPLPDDVPPPPRSVPGYAQRQNLRVKRNALAWLGRYPASLWPKATQAGDPKALDYDLLVAPGSTARGPERFDTQFWIATMNPSDRYVLALPNSVNFRLGTRGTGFANLLLAGDYLRTGMNVGCVEAATMGGMHASRALCGRPKEIVGDNT